MHRKTWILAIALVLSAPVALSLPGTTGSADAPGRTVAETAASSHTERVIFAGNNWEGTASVLTFSPDADKLSHVATLNIIPDYEERLVDSAHHGIAMNAAGDTLCVSGTMSDYVAIVPVDDPGSAKIHVQEDGKSYWSTLTDDGEHCLVSWSGLDSVSVFDYGTGQEVDEIEVGDHPQRVRTGEVQADWYQDQVAS